MRVALLQQTDESTRGGAIIAPPLRKSSYMEDEEEYQSSAEKIIPIEEHTLLFYGKPLVVVRLPDGRPAVSIRSLCENMQLDRKAQVRRIKRTAPIATDLVQNVMIDLGTGGGPQPSQVLALRSLAYWLTGIDHKRTRPEMQDEILKYQVEAVDALYTWAGQRPRALPGPTEQQMIESSSSTAIARPESIALVPMEEPRPEATHRERATYHELMSVWHRHQADQHAQAWRDEVDARIEEQEFRIEAREAVTNLIPEILDRLGPQLLTPAHQRQVQTLAHQLSQLTNKSYATIYDDLKTAFRVAKYSDVPEDQWTDLDQWFKVQIERARTRNGR